MQKQIEINLSSAFKTRTYVREDTYRSRLLGRLSERFIVCKGVDGNNNVSLSKLPFLIHAGCERLLWATLSSDKLNELFWPENCGSTTSDSESPIMTDGIQDTLLLSSPAQAAAEISLVKH